MENNENGMNAEGFYAINNSNKNNSLENQINKHSESIAQFSSIKKATTVLMTSIRTIINKLTETKIPYPNRDDIPLIKIRDENHFENGNDIKNYILSKFDDTKFNRCRKCKKEKNNFFCKSCSVNICDICYKSCKSNNHSLIELEIYTKEVEENIFNINLIKSKNFILPKDRTDSGGIEKENKDGGIFDSFEMNNRIDEKPMEYTYDIILIQAIIDKNYTNYFHYINIKECLYYLRKKYDYITINYNINKNDKKIKIFGNKFVENNKNICQISYGDAYYELTEFLEIKNEENNKMLEIKLLGIDKIIDASYMFDECKSLITLTDITKWNTKNITNMSNIFHLCESLISLPDISKWNTINVKDMNSMFEGCKSLNSLSGISEWKTKNVRNMSFMFNRCEFLKSLPDISEWNTNNVTDMKYLFNECSSLISLPDISKWNTNNVTDMNSMFEGCKSLNSLPDISKWNTSNVTNMSSIICGCESLNSLPDISKWDTSNVTNMSSMMCGCKSLNSLPDISNWYTKNVTDMCYMFNGCKSLNKLPDITKWDINQVKFRKFMFSGCESLKWVGERNFSDLKNFGYEIE